MISAILLAVAHRFAESSAVTSERVSEVLEMFVVKLPSSVNDMVSQFGDVVIPSMKFRWQSTGVDPLIDKLLFAACAVQRNGVSGLIYLLLPLLKDEKGFLVELANRLVLSDQFSHIHPSVSSVFSALQVGSIPEDAVACLGDSQHVNDLLEFLSSPRLHDNLVQFLNTGLSRYLGYPVPPSDWDPGELPSFETCYKVAYHSRLGSYDKSWSRAGYGSGFSAFRSTSPSLDQVSVCFRGEIALPAPGGATCPGVYFSLPTPSWFIPVDGFIWKLYKASRYREPNIGSASKTITVSPVSSFKHLDVVSSIHTHCSVI
jgi:hypothetical protein